MVIIHFPTSGDAYDACQCDESIEAGDVRESRLDLENAPTAFLKLFKGENFGKMLVKLRTGWPMPISSHGAFRPLPDIWALMSSTLERNSFRIGDLFALL
jgi:hypothetical protein